MPDNNVTLDYDREPLVPPSASNVIKQYLQRSFSIVDLFKRASRGWLLGVLGLFLGLLVGVYSVWTTPPRYSVSLGLLPTESAGSDIGDSGALGALAGLVGINSGPVPKFTRFISSFYTTGVAQLMDRKFDLICQTFGNCDRRTHSWIKSEGFDAWWNRKIAEMAHLPDPDRPRTAYDLAQYTKSQVQFSSDKNTHIVTMSMEGRDPKFAAMYITALVQAANDYIKEQDRSVIQQYVSYLNEKLITNTNVTQRDALGTLLLEQERRLMLSSVNVPYAAYIQDGPNVAESNTPLKTLTVDSFLGAILGAVLGVLLSFIPKSSAWRRPLWRRS
jgi:hypothetical protein